MNNYDWLKKIECIIYATKLNCETKEQLLIECNAYTEEHYDTDINGDTVVTIVSPINITFPEDFYASYWNE